MNHWPDTVFIGDTVKKPTPLPTLKQVQRRDALRIAVWWVLLYVIALAVVLMDCIVWRP